MPSPTASTTDQLYRLIGLPHCLMLINVCIDADFSERPYLIPGAKRHPAQDAAAILRHHGIQAETLAGSNQAWHVAQLPTMPAASIPTSGHNNHSVWVTKQRPKVDRIACPWLIRRFVDSKAQFLFVSSSEVLNAADIVRSADTNCLDLTPQSAGLLSASLGFSRISKIDLEHLEASMPLYDAIPLVQRCR
jgi:hypothetical protein